MKTLEERHGHPIQVTQALVSRLILAYGDNVRLLNFAEHCNQGSKGICGMRSKRSYQLKKNHKQTPK